MDGFNYDEAETTSLAWDGWGPRRAAPTCPTTRLVGAVSGRRGSPSTVPLRSSAVFVPMP